MVNKKIKQSLSNKEFINIYEKVPRFCVEVIVKTKEGILLTKRDIPPCKGYWHFPGGTVYLKETFDKAVKRVAKEELNLNVKVIKNIGAMEFIHNYKQPGQRHMISIAFLVKAKKLKDLKLNYQGKEVMFCKSPKDIPKHIVKEHKILLKTILRCEG